MTLHQHLIDWFRQFKLNVLPEERESVTKNFMSGYECTESERCPFLHMLASLVANQRNPHLCDGYIKLKRIAWEDPKRISADDWTHLVDLLSKWSDPELIKE